MNRCHGMIGFSNQIEIRPGVWDEMIVERHYYYSIERNARRYDNEQRVLDTLHLTNRISLISDSYLLEKLYAMRYVIIEGIRWKVTEIEIQRPRIFLTLGGVYNGPEPESDETDGDSKLNESDVPSEPS